MYWCQRIFKREGSFTDSYQFAWFLTPDSHFLDTKKPLEKDFWRGSPVATEDGRQRMGPKFRGKIFSRWENWEMGPAIGKRDSEVKNFSAGHLCIGGRVTAWPLAHGDWTPVTACYFKVNSTAIGSFLLGGTIHSLFDKTGLRKMIFYYPNKAGVEDQKTLWFWMPFFPFGS